MAAIPILELRHSAKVEWEVLEGQIVTMMGCPMTLKFKLVPTRMTLTQTKMVYSMEQKRSSVTALSIVPKVKQILKFKIWMAMDCSMVQKYYGHTQVHTIPIVTGIVFLMVLK